MRKPWFGPKYQEIGGEENGTKAEAGQAGREQRTGPLRQAGEGARQQARAQGRGSGWKEREMKETEEKVLTAREVAERLGISEFMVLLHVTTGVLPCRRLPGGGLRFTEEDLTKFQEEER